jgi:flavin-binding protein dodecin
MPGTFKRVEIVGTSPVSFEEAINVALSEASNSIRRMDWFEVVEMRGMIKEGKVAEYQVIIKIGFKIDRK